MILTRALSALLPRNQVTPEMLVATNGMLNYSTVAGQTVTAESSKSIASAYRCGNILSDDVAKMPLQVFTKRGNLIQRVSANGALRNLAYLVEMQPNRWMSPFIFKKSVILWLLYWGNAYIWLPPKSREMFILPANVTEPVFKDGRLYFETRFANNETEYIPDVEVLHLMINSKDGFVGNSVIGYARETLGRRQGASDTQNRFYSQGLTPAAVMHVAGDLSKDARQKMREAYEEAIAGSVNAGRLAILDTKVTKFEPIQMKAVDMQFLESTQATDVEIANFFGMPIYKLNMGKQSYESNEQQNLDYLTTTLDPYLVQWEQGAALKWLTMDEQANVYLRFNRDVLLRTDAKTRAEFLEKKIFSGQLTPNEARQIEDMSGYADGDRFYIPANMTPVDMIGVGGGV